VPLVDEDDGRRKRWRIVHDDPRRQVASLLEASHYVAVWAALGGVARRSRAVGSALDDLAGKLERVLSPADRHGLAALRDCFDGTERAAIDTTAPDVLWPLAIAIAEKRSCDIAYAATSGRASKYLVLPLKIFAQNGAAYMLAHHRRRDVVMTLALHRIQNLSVTKLRAEPPAGFDARRHVTSLFGVHGNGALIKYQLRFSADVAMFIRERQWHPTQQLRSRSDGGMDLAFECQESYEVSAWVASWRGAVTVMAPMSLRKEMRELGQQLASRYAS